MRPLAPSPAVALAALRACKSVAAADLKPGAPLHPRELQLLAAYQRALGTAHEVDALPAIATEELATLLTSAGSSADERRAIVQRLVVMALIDDSTDGAKRAQVERVRGFARALGVLDEAVVDQLPLAIGRQVMRLSIHMLRHGFLGRQLRQAWDSGGLRGVSRALRAFRGQQVPGLADTYRALGALPPGTLGHGYIQYMRQNNFPLPGQPKGAPEILRFHDIGHVLTGYSTQVSGEIQMAGFEAGYMHDDGFDVAALALFAFHLGIPLPNVNPSRGQFDFDLFEAAWHVGRRLNVDLRTWDPVPHWATPVADLRRQLGL